MAHEVLVNLDLNGNQLLGLRLEVLAADPTAGGLYEGRLWFNSTDNVIKYYDGSTIVPLGAAAAGGVETLTVDNLTIENIGTATNPSVRVKAAGITDTHITGPIAFSKLGAPSSAFSMNGQRITSLADPTAATDGATKAYVDATAAGLAPKDAVRAATTANSALATTFENGDTIDGVVLATGDRILVKNQTAPAENGIYTVNASGAPTRATDADSQAELLGASVFVSEGTVNGNTLWVMTTDAPITVGTTGLAWSQFGGPGAYTAGTGLSLTGNQFALVVPVALASGGTGGTDAATARANLAATTKFSQTIGTGALTSIAVTHNLNSRDVVCEVYDAATFDSVICDVVRTSVNVVTFSFAVAPASNAYRAVIVG